jgi:hypothetical protein
VIAAQKGVAFGRRPFCCMHLRMPKISRDHIIHSSAPTDVASKAAVPPIEFEEPTPPMPECDRVLGLYFRTWNQVEMALSDLFSTLLGAHKSAARIIIASGIRQQTLREIALALGGLRLTSANYRKLEKLLERIGKATTKRNHLTHGAWRLNITVNKNAPNTATWERFYEPTDPRLYEFMAGRKMKQKVRDSHVFTISRINQIAEEAHNLFKEVRAFTAAMTVLPFPEAQPINVSSE